MSTIETGLSVKVRGRGAAFFDNFLDANSGRGGGSFLKSFSAFVADLVARDTLSGLAEDRVALATPSGVASFPFLLRRRPLEGIFPTISSLAAHPNTD
jgi:hypothetical protein